MQESNTKGGGLMLAGLAILAVLFLDVLFSSFHTVGVGQVGIVTRWGRVARTQESGFLVKAPWPIEHLTKMNIRQLKDQQDAAASTKDLQSVTTTVAVNYSLTPSSAKKVYTEVGKNYADIVIAPIIQAGVKSITSQYAASELVTQRPEIEKRITSLFVSKLTDRGITVDNVSLTNFDFSASFKTAIDAKQTAQQNAQKAEYDLQSASLAAQANQVQQAALTPEILEQQAIARWNGVMPLTVAGGSGTILSIPLGK